MNKCSPQHYRQHYRYHYRQQRAAYVHSNRPKRNVTKSGFTTHHIINTQSLEYPESLQSSNANKCGSVPPLFRAHSASSISDLWTTTTIEPVGRPPTSQYSHNPLAQAHRARANNGEVEVANSVRSFADQSQAPSDTPVHSVHNGLNPAWSNPYATGSITHNRNGPGSFHDAASISSLPMSPTCSFTSLPNMMGMGSPFINSTSNLSHQSSSDHHSDLLNAVELLKHQYDALKQNGNQRLTQFLNAQKKRSSPNGKEQSAASSTTSAKAQSPNIRAHGPDGPVISKIITLDKSRESDVGGDEEEVVIITPDPDELKEGDHEKENEKPTMDASKSSKSAQCLQPPKVTAAVPVVHTTPKAVSSVQSATAGNAEKKGNDQCFAKMNSTVPSMPMNAMGNAANLGKGMNVSTQFPMNGMNAMPQYPMNLMNLHQNSTASSFPAPLQFKPPFIPLSTVPQYFSPMVQTNQPSTLLQLPSHIQTALLRCGLPPNALIMTKDQAQNFRKMMNGKMKKSSHGPMRCAGSTPNGGHPSNMQNAQWRNGNMNMNRPSVPQHRSPVQRPSNGNGVQTQTQSVRPETHHRSHSSPLPRKHKKQNRKKKGNGGRNGNGKGNGNGNGNVKGKGNGKGNGNGNGNVMDGNQASKRQSNGFIPHRNGRRQ